MARGIPSASPAVNFREIDLTAGVGNEPTSVGVIAGNFTWGPVAEPTLVSNESGLVSAFGTPTAGSSVDFHSAAYFLRYTDSLYIIRELDDSASATTAKNAYAESTTTQSSPVVKNKSDFDIQVATLDNFSGDSASAPDLVRGHTVIARYPGEIGSSIEVQICPGDAADSAFDGWEYASEFDTAPGTSSYASARDGLYDEVHVVVIDKNGDITGTAGTILEKYEYASVATDAKNADGSSNYIKNLVNETSDYVYLASFGSSLSFDSDAWGLATNVGTATSKGTSKTFTGALPVKTYTLASGANSGALDVGDFARAYALIEDAETYANVDLIIAPSVTGSIDQGTIVNNLVTIAGSTRKDALVVASPNRSAVVNNSRTSTVSDVVTTANRFTASSYLAVDGNFLRVYDKYNDNYIWIPAASSTAGIMAATDLVAAPWFSPAGTRRGAYLGVTDIAYNPKKAERDTLYKAGVNPIVNFTREGILLYGDKTKLGRPSAFDRINVRRLFLAMEKNISRYAKTVLFELNDEFTRAEFSSTVEQYLRDVKARRGVYDFRVICDETNNTPSVIDNNEFIASIFVKPARSINFITLNFVAVRTGVQFEEVVGSV